MEKIEKLVNYKETVDKIKNLNWDQLSGLELQQLMVLSGFAATEFAESLRIAISLYPENESMIEMSKGELKTNNLSFDGYNKTGDHAEFIWHFIKQNKLDSNCPAEILLSGKKYFDNMKRIPEEVRAMSIFSREKELSGIFAEILKAKDWSLNGLSAFKYYLKTHIELDSCEGGHADMLSEFEIDNRVEEFYQARLNLYRCIETLFK